MLKWLVGTASVAIIAFVGFSFYQTYAAHLAEDARLRSEVAAAATAECLKIPSRLASTAGAAVTDEAELRYLNRAAWRCISTGDLTQFQLVGVPAASIEVHPGFPRLASASTCSAAVSAWANQQLDRTDRAAVELQVRLCVLDGLLPVADVRSAVGERLDPLLGAAALFG